MIDDLRHGNKPKDHFIPVDALEITKSNLEQAQDEISAGKC